jgi:hypothetical protein
MFDWFRKKAAHGNAEKRADTAGDDFSPLTDSNHWLGWLGDDPAGVIRTKLEGILRQQVATAHLEWVRLLAKPHYLTGGRKIPDDPNKILVTRAALAAPFELQVRSAERTERLRGVFSWVAIGLDAERRDRWYFDLDADFAWAAEELTARIYELDSESGPDGHS